MAAALAAALFCLTFWAWRGREVQVIDAPSSRLPCVSYAPFRGSQSPFDQTLIIAPEQIEDDLRTLAKLTSCVRIYSVDQGLAQVPAIAERFGLKVILGAWQGRDPDQNAEEVAAVIALANRHPETIRSVIVGNEVLLRREMPSERLIEQIRGVAKAVPAPVSYADVWEFWLKHPEVANAVDFLSIHILPYWEDRPVAVDAATGHVGEVVVTVRRAFPAKRILIAEVGWPSRGRMREHALPSLVNQARFVREMLVLAETDDLAINLMEGIDQPWKRKLEGTVGGFWGVLDAGRRAKFPLTGPVSGQPRWVLPFAASAGLALLPFLWTAARRPTLRPLGWLAMALAAPAGSCALVLAALDVPATSAGLLGWSAGIVGLVIAAASPALTMHILRTDAPAALPTPAFMLIERVRAGRLCGMVNIADALGWLRLFSLFGVAATALCLAFDGRYREFPTAAYSPPVACFLVLALVGRGRARTKGSALEEAALAAIAVAATGAVLAGEGLGNDQALAWAGVVLAAAAIPALELWPRRCALQPKGARGDEERGTGTEFGIVEHEGHRTRASRRNDRGPA